MNIFRMIQQLFRPMMSCEDVNQFLVDYLEERLPAETRVKFEKHLAMCPNCVPFFEQYKQTIVMTREDGQIEVPQDIADHTLAFLRDNMGK